MYWIWTLIICILLLTTLRVEVKGELTKDVLFPLRGVMIVVVLISHLYPQVGNELPWLGVIGNGSAAVAVFFALSGYGLVKQLERKGSGYLKGFIARSARKLFLPTLLCTALWVVCLVVRNEFCLLDMLEKLIFYGSFPLQPVWYVAELFVLYVIFWMSFSSGSKLKAYICSISLVAVLFVGMVLLPGWGPHWWLSVMAFPCGLLFAKFEQSLLRSRYFPVLGLVFVTGVFWAILCVVDSRSYVHHLAIVGWNAAIAISCLMVCFHFQFHLAIFDFLGRISFELFLLHMMFVIALKPLLQGPWSYLLAVSALSIASSYCFHLLLRRKV